MLIQIIVSAEVERKGKTVLDDLLFSYLFFNHLYDFFLSLMNWFRLLLGFLLFLRLLNRILYCFLLSYILNFSYFLLLDSPGIFGFLMYVNTYISLQALALQEVLAKLDFVLVIFLHKVDIPMVLSTSSSQVTLPHLILLANCLSLHERLTELILRMSKSTRQPSATISTVRTHFRLVMSSFIVLCDPFSFDIAILCKQVIINKSAFKVMLILCLCIICRQQCSGNQRQRVDLFVGPYLLLVFWLSC